MASYDLAACTPYRAGEHAEFVSAENRCRHIGKNPRKNWIRQFHVDGGIFPTGTEPSRCDFLLVNDIARRAYYIELKGSDIEKAIAQVDGTVELFSPSLPSYDIFRRVVYRTGTHKVNSSKVQQWKARYPGRVVVKERELTEVVSGPG